ncbi:MAG: adenylate/guanylate cyclase domain-containing protein [Treponema sp.]|nr:adenylate/guanylate cyclase domain-containing protein [Treponema sp.]
MKKSVLKLFKKKVLSNLSQTEDFSKVSFYALRILPTLIFALLFLLPMGMTSLDLSDSKSVGSLIYPSLLPFTSRVSLYETLLQYGAFFIYILPLSIIFLIASIFVKKINNVTVFLVTYIALSLYLICAVSCLVIFANCRRWFFVLPSKVYAVLIFSFLLHILFSFLGVISLRSMNETFSEYKKFQAESKQKTKFSIKTKLMLTIISMISIIIAVFAILILTGYKTMFTEAVSDVGRTQAEQTATVYDSADGKYEKISTYFSQQKEANSYADTPFERIDIITANKPGNIVFLKEGEKVHFASGKNLGVNDINWPTYDVFSYTTAMGRVKYIDEEERIITPDQAKKYFLNFQNGSYKRHPVYHNEFCKYIYPVSLNRKNGERFLVGFSVVTYRTEILMRSYFHARVFVFVMALVFLYISIVSSIFISDFITNPLLYLKANVRKTSNTLKELLDGNSKISAENLTFDDSIKTKDETKDLSKEIKNMVGIIRGIIPYISFSTLQAAEKEKKKTTSSRELCFLFTDIRGFTSLCEGKQPKEVVEILNHYLDIETEIILNNGGDVDKFVGDEMMAFFSGPKKEINACKAAMEIRTAMRVQQQQALASGDDFISIGIGINSGKVVFGSVGAHNRMDFTSIGDTVNLAARLEGANKAYGSKSIITEAVYSKLKGSFVCRELDFIKVKGKKQPVRIYEILQTKAAASDKLFEIKELFEKGLTFYRKQKWDNAKEMFKLCSSKYDDMPSIVFMERIKHFKRNPPPRRWDGVFEMNVK